MRRCSNWQPGSFRLGLGLLASDFEQECKSLAGEVMRQGFDIQNGLGRRFADARMDKRDRQGYFRPLTRMAGANRRGSRQGAGQETSGEKGRTMETVFESIEQAQGAATKQKLQDDLRALARDVEELIKATSGDVSERAKEARSRLQEALERAKATCQQLEAKTAAAARTTDRVIREHPYESIGIAFGIGLLLGVIVARR